GQRHRDLQPDAEHGCELRHRGDDHAPGPRRPDPPGRADEPSHAVRPGVPRLARPPDPEPVRPPGAGQRRPGGSRRALRHRAPAGPPSRLPRQLPPHQCPRPGVRAARLPLPEGAGPPAEGRALSDRVSWSELAMEPVDTDAIRRSLDEERASAYLYTCLEK